MFAAAAPLVTQAAGKTYAIGREAARRGANAINSFSPKITGTITPKLDDALSGVGLSLNEIGRCKRQINKRG